MILDTHVFVWFQLGAGKLKPQDIDSITHAFQEERLFLSAISVWEMAMLTQQGRLNFQQPFAHWLNSALDGITVLPISSEIAVESVQLPQYTPKDPADRFIIATSRVHAEPLLTKDTH